MTEQTQNDDTTKPNETNEGDDDKIELDAHTYEALLNRLSYLEEQSKSGGGESDDDDDDVDKLAKRGKQTYGGDGGEDGPPDLEKMTQAELAGYLEQGLTERYIQPVLQKLYQIDYQMQIDRLTQREEFKDFHDYDKEILGILKKNPQMGLEDAYYLAKKRSGGKDKERETGRDENLLRHLPPPKRRPAGEKPGAPSSATRENTSEMSTRDAADKAFDEVFGKK